MGQFIAFPGVNPPLSRPKVNIPDVILPDAGALALFEFAHPATKVPISGVPANGATIENIAASQALAAIGGSINDFHSAITIGPQVSGRTKTERSGKGGLHHIQSQSNTAVTGDGWLLPVPLAILNYLASNPTHKVFSSMWGRMTREGSGTDSWSAITFTNTPGSQINLYIFSSDGQNYPTQASSRIGYRRSPNTSWRHETGSAAIVAPGTPVMANIAVNGNSGAMDSTRNGKAMANRLGNPYPGTSANGSMSNILYRFYLEDLTLSGRNYATVDGLDQAEFTKQVLTAGGRYYNDTFTDPTTIP